MDALQEWSSRVTALLDLVVQGTWPTLRTPRFDHERGSTVRGRDELMMGDLDASNASFGDRYGTRRRGPTNMNTDYSKEASGGILNGFLHILADVTDLGRLGFRANNRWGICCSVSKANGGYLSS
jgi:hypothetical protein